MNLSSALIFVKVNFSTSLGDLDETACELSRLIELYSAPWDGRADALKRLHAQYRRNCRLLNVAIKKLHTATAGNEQLQRLKTTSKWEQLFSIVMLTKGIGRRWKFRIPQLRSAAAKGPEAVSALIGEGATGSNEVEAATTGESETNDEVSDIEGKKSDVESGADDVEQEDEQEEDEEDESDVSDIDVSWVFES